MKFIINNIILRNIMAFLSMFTLMYIVASNKLSLWQLKYALTLVATVYLSAWLNNYLLYNYFLNKRNLSLYLLFLLPLLGLMMTVEHWAFVHVEMPNEQQWTLPRSLVTSIIFLILGFGFNAVYRQLVDREKYLEKELMIGQKELHFLQGQVNPHFLFNALNNLYSASIVEPESVSAHILQLAELLRYQLTTIKLENTALQEEVEFIENYVEVEKRRLGRQVDVKYTLKGETKDKLIAPLIFLPFIENAFKYSIGGLNKGSICIDIEIEKDGVVLQIENTVPERLVVTPISTGIGIENAKQRLDILYPEMHDLTILPTDHTFTVRLEIKGLEKKAKSPTVSKIKSEING